MEKKKLKYWKRTAFINREKELKDLEAYIDEEPEAILFLHGPKSSGKTTLLYKLLQQIEKVQKLDVKFLNLRKIYTEFSDEYNYKDFLKMLFNVEDEEEKKGKLSGGINVGFFKINSEIEQKMQKGRVDPFKTMEKEFSQLHQNGVKPILIIDELQALDKVYMNNGRERRLIIELFNFFVAMTKESHLAHIIIASSDGYFLNTVYEDSRLKKCSTFYKVDYLEKEDVLEWLLNLEKYSKITNYTLTKEDAEKIWDVVGGSMWEIQAILSNLFRSPLDTVISDYKQKMLGMITYSIVKKGRKKREKLLSHFVENDKLFARDTEEEDEELLRELVSNNILYFDPTRAVYYPQGKSFHWGIRLYFEG